MRHVDALKWSEAWRLIIVELSFPPLVPPLSLYPCPTHGETGSVKVTCFEFGVSRKVSPLSDSAPSCGSLPTIDALVGGWAFCTAIPRYEGSSFLQ